MPQHAPTPPRLPRENAWARAWRWMADRRHLAEMDDRLLRDVGLTREDVRRSLPFAPAAETQQALHCPARRRPGLREDW